MKKNSNWAKAKGSFCWDKQKANCANLFFAKEMMLLMFLTSLWTEWPHKEGTQRWWGRFLSSVCSFRHVERSDADDRTLCNILVPNLWVKVALLSTLCTHDCWVFQNLGYPELPLLARVELHWVRVSSECQRPWPRRGTSQNSGKARAPCQIAQWWTAITVEFKTVKEP